jgi:hypothetical protein
MPEEVATQEVDTPSNTEELQVDEFDDYLDELPEQPTKEPQGDVKEDNKGEEPPADKSEEPPAKPSKDVQEDKPEEISKVKIGENEYTLEEIEEFKKSHENYDNWRTNLTQKSQIAANLTEEQITAIMRATENLKKIEVPKEFDSPMPEIDFQNEDPFTVEVEDSEGLPAEIDLKPYLKPFVKNYESKISELENKLSNYETENKQIQQEKVITEMKVNMKEFEDIAIDNLSLETIDSILVAGNSHPDYDKLMRYKAVASYARDADLPFPKAYGKLYAKEIADRKEGERLKNNLKGKPPEPPSKGGATSDIDEMYDEMFGSDTVEDKLAALP